jgi:hypothetical protein
MKKTPLPKTRISLTIDDRQWKEIIGYADYEGESANAVVRRFIREGLERLKKSR